MEASGATSTAPDTTVADADHEATATTSPPPSPETEPGPSTTSDPNEGEAHGAVGSQAGQCPSASMFAELQQQFGDSTGALPPSAAMTAVLDVLGQYVPPDLEADFETMRTATTQLLDAIEAAGPGAATMGPEVADQLTAAIAAIDTPEVNVASQRVEAYFEQVCPQLPWNGEDLEPPGSGPN